MIISMARRPAGAMEDSLAGSSASRRDQVLDFADSQLDRAYRLAGLMLGDEHEAQDAVQDALLRAWRSADSLRDRDNLQAWFDRILVNGCLDRLRRRGKVRLVAIEDASNVAAVNDPFLAIVARDEILDALGALDHDERAVIVLHYWADLTLEGVSKRLATSVGTVKSRLSRALFKIRSRLNEVSIEVAP